MAMTKDVETYFQEGCGRCSLGGTPSCKVLVWQKEIAVLRNIVLDCGLVETAKWGVACYTFQNKNILSISALKDAGVITFFKGSLLADTDGILGQQGENSQSFRVLKFKSPEEIVKIEHTLKAYIYEAIEVEKAGLKVAFKKVEDMTVPEELIAALNKNSKLKEAFEALTPGRRKGYLLHFSGAKQASTRETRIEKWTPQILKGKGMND